MPIRELFAHLVIILILAGVGFLTGWIVLLVAAAVVFVLSLIGMDDTR